MDFTPMLFPDESSEKCAVRACTALVMSEDPSCLYEPMPQEIEEYGKYLGLCLPDESDLLYIARRGLQERTPEGWSVETSPNGEIYYKSEDGMLQWEHPCDEKFRALIKEHRAQNEPEAVGEGLLPLKKMDDIEEGGLIPQIELPSQPEEIISNTESIINNLMASKQALEERMSSLEEIIKNQGSTMATIKQQSINSNSFLMSSLCPLRAEIPSGWKLVREGGEIWGAIEHDTSMTTWKYPTNSYYSMLYDKQRGESANLGPRIIELESLLRTATQQAAQYEIGMQLMTSENQMLVQRCQDYEAALKQTELYKHMQEREKEKETNVSQVKGKGMGSNVYGFQHGASGASGTSGTSSSSTPTRPAPQNTVLPVESPRERPMECTEGERKAEDPVEDEESPTLERMTSNLTEEEKAAQRNQRLLALENRRKQDKNKGMSQEGQLAINRRLEQEKKEAQLEKSMAAKGKEYYPLLWK